MEKETFDLIDTAIKIGLGAVIAGISTYIMASRQFKFEQKKVDLDDRRHLIKQISFDLQSSKNGMNNLALLLRRAVYHENFEQDELIAQAHSYILESQSCLSPAMANATLLGLDEIFNGITHCSARLNELLNIVDDAHFDSDTLDKMQKIANSSDNIFRSLNQKIAIAYSELSA